MLRRAVGDEFILGKFGSWPPLPPLRFSTAESCHSPVMLRKPSAPRRIPPLNERAEARPVAAAEAAVQHRLAAVGPVVEHQVDHAGDGIRAVLRGRAVTQHLDPVKGRRRNRPQVGAAGAIADHGRRAPAARPCCGAACR